MFKKLRDQWRDFWRSISGRCRYCGGPTWFWDDTKCYCKICGKRQ